jgi:hypothetical protein
MNYKALPTKLGMSDMVILGSVANILQLNKKKGIERWRLPSKRSGNALRTFATNKTEFQSRELQAGLSTQ